jgi:APA family basic amino acid/polyamine antiporter
VIYSLIAISAIGLTTSSGLASSTSPLAFAASRTGLTALVLVVSLGALVATSGVILTGILGTSRVMYAMGRDGEVPRAISRLDRFSTPVVAIVVSLLLAVAMMPAASFGTIVESSNTCVISAYAIINLAALKTHLKYRHNGKSGILYTNSFFIVPVLGVVTISIFFLFLGVESMEIAGAVFFAATIFYVVRTKFATIKRTVPKTSIVRVFGQSRSSNTSGHDSDLT